MCHEPSRKDRAYILVGIDSIDLRVGIAMKDSLLGAELFARWWLVAAALCADEVLCRRPAPGAPAISHVFGNEITAGADFRRKSIFSGRFSRARVLQPMTSARSCVQPTPARSRRRIFMRVSFARRGLLLALAVGTAACTTSTTTPASPTVTTLVTPQVAGVFQGTMTMTSVTGGAGPLPNAGTLACVHNAFQSALPQTNDISLVLTQDGSNVVGRLTSASTGLACSYQGVIGSGNSLVLDADPPSADRCTDAAAGKQLNFLCTLADGTTQTFKMDLIGSSVTGTFDGWPINVTALRARAALTYNINFGSGIPQSNFVVNFGGPLDPSLPAGQIVPFVLNKR